MLHPRAGQPRYRGTFGGGIFAIDVLHAQPQGLLFGLAFFTVVKGCVQAPAVYGALSPVSLGVVPGLGGIPPLSGRHWPKAGWRLRVASGHGSILPGRLGGISPWQAVIPRLEYHCAGVATRSSEGVSTRIILVWVEARIPAEVSTRNLNLGGGQTRIPADC